MKKKHAEDMARRIANYYSVMEPVLTYCTCCKAFCRDCEDTMIRTLALLGFG
jgi:hypothetical protein